MIPPKARTDELQPLTEVQAKQAREYVRRLTKGAQTLWEWAKEGEETTAELRITPELVILYADGVEDYNPWYEAWGMYGGTNGESPFGPAIVPPLLVSQWALLTHVDFDRPYPQGGVHTYHNSDILAPIPIGTVVRYRGKVVKKFIKRDRRYIRSEITLEDADTGRMFFKETREELCQYKTISEQEHKK